MSKLKTWSTLTAAAVLAFGAVGFVPVSAQIGDAARNKNTAADISYCVAKASNGAEPAGDYGAQIGEVKYSSLNCAIIAGVPNDGTATTVTVLKDDADAEGIIFNSGKNVTVDFGGHTLVFGNKLVGSSKTINLGLQLLKNSTIVFQNGTLKTQGTNIKMLVQNYANLTLNDMKLDGTSMNAGSYVLSNNNGLTQIVGNTDITAGAGSYALDACWAPNKGYPDGAQVVINTTGTIEGKIQADVWGSLNESQKGDGIKTNLTINNVVHIGEFEIENEMKPAVELAGGIYSNAPEDMVIADGHKKYPLDNGVFVVEPEVTGINVKVDGQEQYLPYASLTNTPEDMPGVPTTAQLEAIAMTNVAAGASSTGFTYTSADSGVATVDENGLVTAVFPGSTVVKVTSTYEPSVTKDVSVYVSGKYAVLEGDKQSVEETKAHDISIRFEAPFEHLYENEDWYEVYAWNIAERDALEAREQAGETVAPEEWDAIWYELEYGKDYTMTSGSTVVTLTSSFLNTLPDGEYGLGVDSWYYGWGEAGFTVTPLTEEATATVASVTLNSPVTGGGVATSNSGISIEGGMMGAAVIVGAMSGAVALAYVVKRKRA